MGQFSNVELILARPFFTRQLFTMDDERNSLIAEILSSSHVSQFSEITPETLLYLSANKRARFLQPAGTINLNIPPDGYTWLKYGQKNLAKIKKRRHYYRCIMQKDTRCPVKKYVDFPLLNPNDMKISYTGNHNHPPAPLPPMPPKSEIISAAYLQTISVPEDLPADTGGVSPLPTTSQMQAAEMETLPEEELKPMVDLMDECFAGCETDSLESLLQSYSAPPSHVHSGETRGGGFLESLSVGLPSAETSNAALERSKSLPSSNLDYWVDTFEKDWNMIGAEDSQEGGMGSPHMIEDAGERVGETVSYNLAPLPANRPSSSQISTPIGKFQVFPKGPSI